MLFAITRQVSSSIGDCELTHLERRVIDVDRARREHDAYRRLLGELSATVIQLPEDPFLPDSVFVEDMAIALDEVAIIARSGAESRRREAEPIAEILGRYRRLVPIEEPGTLDGGDVVVLDNRIWVGLSSRTNDAAIEQLENLLSPAGYDVLPMTVEGCLHLKSAATVVGTGTVLVNPEWVDPSAFDGCPLIEVDPREPFAANAVVVGSTTIVSEAHPATRSRIDAAGFSCRTVEFSEIVKAEGALTCCSILFEG